MAENTRTVTLLRSEDEKLQLAVNPRDIVLSRPQNTLRYRTILGETVHVPRGGGLTEVTLETFLPGERSRFYRGTPPEEALDMLRRWQAEGAPVRLLISGSEIRPWFLICALRQRLTEGDRDVGVSVNLCEYTQLRTVRQEGQSAGGLAYRLDERRAPAVYVTEGGEDLWEIARRIYGDGSHWREIAKRNGISDPHCLPAGKELYLA